MTVIHYLCVPLAPVGWNQGFDSPDAVRHAPPEPLMLVPPQTNKVWPVM
jgi:hypothetical protein